MEQGDARPTMGLKDVLELLPHELELHRKMLPANRTFVLRRTSKTMCAAVKNAKLDTVVVRRSGVKFANGAGLQDKLNCLNAWCSVTVLRLNQCELREGGAQAIAAALHENHTFTDLNLATNRLREGGAQAIAAALRENHTLANLNLGVNALREGGAQAIAAALRVNTTLQTLYLWRNELGEGGESAVRESWGNRGGKLVFSEDKIKEC